LTVKATGIQAYQWQWTKDGKTWNNCSSSGYNKASFSFTMSAVVNGRQYRCKLTGLDGSTLYTSSATMIAGSGATITTQPKSQSAKVGAAITLTVAGVGIKSYQWQWSKDGTTWNNNTGTGYNTATFSFKMTEAFHGRKYRCVVKGADGKAVYSSAATVSAAATVTTQPKSQSAKIGATVSLTVGGAAIKAYQWQWSKDGKTWNDCSSSGSKTASFAFKMTEAFHGRQYRCKLTGLNGGTAYTSAAAIGASATITEHPVDTHAKPGVVVNLSVTASAVTAYQWQYSTDEGATWKNETGSNSSTGYTTATFSLHFATSHHGRKYRCMLTGLDGGTVYSNAATVLGSANIYRNPVSRTVGSGETVTFNVGAACLKAYQWQYSANSGTSWYTYTADDSQTDTISLTANQTLSGRMFRCRVTGLDGRYVYSTAATLTVTSSGVVITTHPKSQSIELGQPVTFTVKATGVKSYQWQYSNDGTSFYNSSAGTGVNTDTYTFTTTAVCNGRRYRCQLTGQDDSVVYTNAATLTLTSSGIVITTHPQSQSILLGQPVTFTVKATGVKSYQWQYSNDGTTFYNSSAGTGYNTDTYTFTTAAVCNGRRYRCQLTGLDDSVVYTNAATLTVTESTDSISLNQTSFTSISADGSNVSLKVTSSGKWSASSDATWLLPVQSTGAAATSYTAYVRVYRNRTASARTGHVTYTCGTASVTVTFTQKAATYRALLVGNSEFIYNNDLICCAYDVTHMNTLLSSINGGLYSGHITKKENTTGSTLQSAVSSAFSGAADGDVSLFYISSHGVVYEDDVSADLAGAVLMSDESLVKWSTLAAWLNSANPNNKVIVLIDTCGSGSPVTTAGKRTAFDEKLYNRSVISAFAAVDRGITTTVITEENGVQKLGELRTSKFYVISACQADETSVGYTTGSLFTNQVINAAGSGLPADTSGDGLISIQELYNYTYNACSSKHHPMMWASDTSYLVFWE
ncbi:MAG: caspase family protein, partial [Clostridia bacterium]|nr:caspase family protein [Clostridia bacterium]